MSSNEVRIDITAKNMTKSDFAAARKDADSFAKDSDKFGKSAASNFGKSFSSTASVVLRQASTSLAPILGTIGAAAAPFIGAAISGAVLGGAGIGGVLGGVMLASKDPRIKSAGKSLGDSVLSDLTKSASVFVGPMLTSIGKIRQGFKDISPDIDRIFKDSARYLDPLTEGFIAAGKGLVAGLADAVSQAGPVIEVISEGVASLGDAFGDMLSDISENSEGAAAALKSIFDATEGLIRILGPLISGLTKVYEVMDALHLTGGLLQAINTLMGGDEPSKFATNMDAVASSTEKANEAAQIYGELLAKALDDQDKATSGLQYYTDTLKDQLDAVNEWTSAELAAKDAANGHIDALDELADAQLAAVDPTFALLRAQEDLADAQKDVTDATKKFGKNSPEAQEALRKLAERAIKLEGAVGDAAGSLTDGINPALRSTLRAAGLTEGQIDDLERQFKTAKSAGDRFSKRYTAEARVNGVGRALSQLYSVQDAARDIPRAVTIAMRITGVTNVSKAAAAIRKQYAHGGITGAAETGGIREGMTLVGEGGPELVDLPPGSNVKPAGTTKAMLESAGNSNNRTVLEIRSGGTRMDDLLVELLQKAVRVRGGDVQVVLGRG